MELVWIIYLIDVVGSLKGISSIAVASLFLLGISLMMVAIFNFLAEVPEKTFPTIKKMKAVKITIWCFVIIFLCKLIPSQDTAYKMLAAYGVSEVAQNEDVQKLAGKSLQVIEKAMDKYIQDSTPVKE